MWPSLHPLIRLIHGHVGGVGHCGSLNQQKLPPSDLCFGHSPHVGTVAPIFFAHPCCCVVSTFSHHNDTRRAGFSHVLCLVDPFLRAFI